MASFLLDTSVIIDAINNKKNRRQFLADLIKQGNTLACCPINIIEVYAGMRPAEEPNTRDFLETLRYYPITWEIARLAGLTKRDYGKKGITLAATDVAIAAVTMHHQIFLITDNLKHYPMEELKLHPLPQAWKGPQRFSTS